MSFSNLSSCNFLTRASATSWALASGQTSHSGDQPTMAVICFPSLSQYLCTVPQTGAGIFRMFRYLDGGPQASNRTPSPHRPQWPTFSQDPVLPSPGWWTNFWFTNQIAYTKDKERPKTEACHSRLVGICFNNTVQ